MPVKMFAILTIIISLMTPVSRAEDADLAYLAEKKQPIMVFVGEFANYPDTDGADTDEFKKHLEDTLIDWKHARFKVTDDIKESDIEISGSIRSFPSSDNESTDSIIGIPAMLLGFLIGQKNAESEVQFIVKDPGTGIELWNSVVKGYVKRPVKTKEEKTLAYEMVSRNFISKCFGKGK